VKQIEIKEEFQLPGTDITLEEGDRIVIQEGNFMAETPQEVIDWCRNSIKNFREPSGFPYSVGKQSMSIAMDLVEDAATESSDIEEIDITKDFISTAVENDHSGSMSYNELVDWLREEKGRTYRYVDAIIEEGKSFDDLNDLLEKAYLYAITDGAESVIRFLAKDCMNLNYSD